MNAICHSQVTSLDAEDEHDLLLETRMEQDYLQQKQADVSFNKEWKGSNVQKQTREKEDTNNLDSISVQQFTYNILHFKMKW